MSSLAICITHVFRLNLKILILMSIYVVITYRTIKFSESKISQTEFIIFPPNQLQLQPSHFRLMVDLASCLLRLKNLWHILDVPFSLSLYQICQEITLLAFIKIYSKSGEDAAPDSAGRFSEPWLPPVWSRIAPAVLPLQELS